MHLSLKEILATAKTFLDAFASSTPTKIDDLLLVAVNLVLGNETILNWLQSLLDSKNHSFVSGDVTGVMAAAPPVVQAEFGKIGDGKILEMLTKLLPLILKLLGL